MNPFRESIVASPWEATPTDVPEIHHDVFDQCLSAIDHVRHSRHSAALLIHGAAGSGKTHLLSRLRAKLTPDKPASTGRQECLFVWVRLQTSPRMIWRTLRRMLVEDWFRPVTGAKSQFERILFHRLAEIRTAEGDLERWYEYMLDQVPDGLDKLMDQIADTLHLDRNMAIAFKHIAFHRHVRDLRAWLAGTSLPQAALERLNLVQEDGSDEEREDESKRIVLLLCQLAGNGLPIVLSFDQVEALQLVPGDQDSLFAFGQLASTLHDGTTNVLLVSCVQSAFATELRDRARSADYDRMTSLGARSLDPLSRNEAKQLITRRLEGVDARPFPWPLSPDDVEDLFAKNDVTPRRLLALCAERYETRSRTTDSVSLEEPAKPLTPDEFLAARWEWLLQEKLAANVPDRTEEILRHGFPLLVNMIAPDIKPVRDEQLQDVPLVFEEGTVRTGISFCTQSNMNSLSAQLKRLKTQFAPPRLQRLVLVRETRIELSPGAKVARKHLDELRERRALVLFPAVGVLAALDAVRALLSDAKSGDLACQGQSIAPQTVEGWLKEHLAPGLRDLVDEVLRNEAANATSKDDPGVEADA